MIDLRSDTVTQPDDEMRQAMANAVVGDDVYREDPTVRKLEEAAASRLGFDASVFVPTGTMGNQIALCLHARPGDEVVCDADSHIVHYEMGAMSAIGGLMPRPLASQRGHLDPVAVAGVISRSVPYHSRTGVLALENSHNLAGGTIYPPEQLDRLCGVARQHQLPVHLDGARIFNAAAALDLPAAALCQGADTVMFCLSKGLGAPVGSLLCGSTELIAEARRLRKMLGGGMRQVGVLAAAGLVALDKGPGRLVEDHENARRLAEALAELPGIRIDLDSVQTNIVQVRLAEGDDGDGGARFIRSLREAGVLVGPLVGGRIRFVTHRDVDRRQVDQAIAVVRKVAGEQFDDAEWAPAQTE